MVYLANRRYTNRKVAYTDVKVYCNTEQAPVLYHNGKKVGKMSESQPGVFRHLLTLTSGKNQITVKTQAGKQK